MINWIQRPVCCSRKGAVLVSVLVCLAVASTILMGALTLSLRYQKQFRNEIQLEQTRWLLDAGIDTAIAQFKSNPDFGKHTLSTDEYLQPLVGTVDIQVLEQPGSRTAIRVTAKITGPHELSPLTKRSRTIVLSNQKTTAEDEPPKSK